MTANGMDGRIRSALGEHLVALLIVAIVVLGAVAAIPTIEAQAKGTAAQTQERVNLPLVVASSLDTETASSQHP
jgi:hypothetical protein